MPDSELTMFERVEIQMKYAVPLIRQIQAVLGEDAVKDALAQANRRKAEQAKISYPQEGPRSCARVRADFEVFGAGERLSLDYREESDERVVVIVTDCQYADLMRRLNASDLGELLLCGTDFASAAGVGLDLARKQTCMSGADHCDFCFTPLSR